jgi:hypothetical protein
MIRGRNSTIEVTTVAKTWIHGLSEMEEPASSSPELVMSHDEDALQAPGLCNRCKDMIAAWESTPLGKGRALGYIYYETTDLLETTANAGCGVCQLFLEGILAEDQERLRQNKYQPREGEKPITRRYKRWVAGNMRSLRLDHVDDLGREFAASWASVRDEDGQYLGSNCC